MTDEHDRVSGAAERPVSRLTTRFEPGVPHGKDLVDDEDFSRSRLANFCRPAKSRSPDRIAFHAFTCCASVDRTRASDLSRTLTRSWMRRTHTLSVISAIHNAARRSE